MMLNKKKIQTKERQEKLYNGSLKNNDDKKEIKKDFRKTKILKDFEKRRL